MTSTTNGIGMFTAENIVAILQSIPETNGTYEQIAQAAEQRGSHVKSTTMAKWVTRGKADLRDNKPHTAYARFATQFTQLVNQHCKPNDNRNREMDQAMGLFTGSCECGNPKLVFPDGSVAEACRLCLEIQHQTPRKGPKSTCERCGGNLTPTPDGKRCLQCGRGAISRNGVHAHA